MLRIVKKRTQQETVSPTVNVHQTKRDIIHGWSVRYLDAETTDEIGTIVCSHFVIEDMSRPKKLSFHTEKALKLWYTKLLAKKYRIEWNVKECGQDSSGYFTMIGMMKGDQTQAYVKEVIIFPLMNRSMEDYTDMIQLHNGIPKFLKIEMRSHLEELN